MDQSRYWIQNQGTNCFKSQSFGDSWEEQAFAEDAAGPLGGCIWPPRSYTCSFCRREFRSAQALGGHMNVHRRDRARLKQISSPKNNQVVEPNTSSLERCLLQNPNEICNPKFDDLDHPLFSSSSTRPNTVSILRPFTCSFGDKQQKSTKITPMLSFMSKFDPQKRLHIDELGNQEKGCATQAIESNSITSKSDTYDHTEVRFADNLISLVKKRYETPIFHENDDEHDGLIFKKRRIHDDVQSFFPNSTNIVIGDEIESVHVPLKRSPNSTLENLDLELRLGDRP
ncbi:uncharacterized protein [Rutidosis leptorrhynchoides]|uniref:uncharacterized protein n=1 Tax=Rutidosis leptorrhynchoides TaxID=125765 RepID=UPI003A9A4E37